MSIFSALIESTRIELAEAGAAGGSSGPTVQSTERSLASKRKGLLGTGMVGKTHQVTGRQHKKAMRQYGKSLSAAGTSDRDSEEAVGGPGGGWA